MMRGGCRTSRRGSRRTTRSSSPTTPSMTATCPTGAWWSNAVDGGRSMATVTGAPVKQDEPRPRLWTKDEYYRMGDLGWFNGQKAELLEGEIVVTSPQG